MRREQENREKQPERNKNHNKLWNMFSLIGLFFCVVAAVWGYQSGYFHSVDALQNWMEKFGGVGIVIFILIQIVQVVFPILPGGISCLAGVLLYGPWKGFVYNYVGICIGSMAAFGIARNLGRAAFEKKFSPAQLRRFESWTGQNSRFPKLFAAAIFFPVAPDDLLCYLAGTTSMTWKQFICIILLGKPCSIALYSLGLTKIFQLFFPAG